jgi:N-acetyl-1-D-myo-inositol-2-amino-2-deoxy-alpha-D-glucopyranoside deacetylase
MNGVLLVHAHPDDECFATAGLIARTVAEGRRVDLVTCTGGEEGEIHDPDLDPEEAKPRLKAIRRQELQCSVDALRGDGPGTLELHLLGYRDSGMMGTESNQRPDAFWNADLDEATGRLVEIVRRVRPRAVVTYDANGNYGHPDHINAHRVAAGAWEAAADPARYPEAGEPHAVERFYEVAFNRDAWGELVAAMTERGIKMPWMERDDDEGEKPQEQEPDTAQEEEFGVPAERITTFLDVAQWYDQKRASMACHRTQRQDLGWVLDMPDELARRASSPEHLVLTRWRDREIPAGYREDAIF